ncbi:hypothetical protein [Vulcanisaeta sp. JCM 16161]|uniref:hypothetical protein n=1 Tax=Vulcanisaeta sp. JCM 16161 TaxID=1295372 RepID=UPI000AEF1EB1|nr:hypothetical protein [Vulcanisaeta sp. JCM 16161]
MLREDEEFRLAVVGLLGISDVQSSIRQLINAVNELTRTVQRLAEGQDAMRTDINRLWEENRRINENIEKFWQENKRINENIERLWQENNKIWQEIRRLSENQEKLWQEFRAFREEQGRFNRWMLSALVEFRDSLGGAYEYYTAHWIERWLEGRGINCDVRVNVTIPVDGSREIDAICYDPLVIGEATIKVSSVDEAEREVGKLLDNARAAEKFFNRRVYALVLAVETAPEQVAEYLRRRANELGIVLVLGREYS